MRDPRVGGVTFAGPLQQHWEVRIDGYAVPGLEAVVEEDGTVNLQLDGRFTISGTAEECAKWAGFIAHAMAFAAGYSCHGADSELLNPYRRRIWNVQIRGNKEPDA